MPSGSQPSGPVLVTGASGFVGSAIATALRDAGHPIRVLVRASSPRINIDPREGNKRLDHTFALQEAFGEYHFRDLSPNYDFVSSRTGIQFFNEDFRGFLFADNNLGERIFGNIRCTACHVPSMQTGTSAIAALSNKTVPLYSDLLLHRMGAGLADGIQQGLAKGDQFRTAPLWGLSARRFFLHDGRAKSPDEAAMLHGGEAAPSRDRYSKLPPRDRQAVQEFLNSL